MQAMKLFQTIGNGSYCGQIGRVPMLPSRNLATAAPPGHFLAILVMLVLGLGPNPVWCQVPPSAPAVEVAPLPTPVAALGLDDLIQMSLDQNPNLRQAGFEVDAARGKALQAGLCPNPTVSLIGDELGDRTGPQGVNTLPLVSQEIVTAGKLRLNRAVAMREMDQAALALVRQRFVLFTLVRQGYFETLAAQRRVAILSELVGLADKSFDATRKLLEAKQVAKLDLIQLQVELNRFRAELEAARREQVAVYRRMAASIGVPDLPLFPLKGSLESPLPEYQYDAVRAHMLAVYPDIQSAQIGIKRAQLVLKRAQVEPIPNVTVGAGYVRQNQNRSNDWMLQASFPVPFFNRNQGNIQAAHAELRRAMQDVVRVENDLTSRLAISFGDYAAARERADLYKKSILPDSAEAYRLAMTAYKGGQFEYLRVVQAQRTVAEAQLEYVRVLAAEWKAASDIAGLLLEEQWPCAFGPGWGR